MRSRSMLFALAMFVAVPLFAGTKVYSTYETARQALAKGALPEIQSSAKALATAARSEKEDAIAAKADVLANATDLAASRKAFAALSDSVIAFRAKTNADAAPMVVYCAMEKKSWLQPKREISNPYVAPSMRKCGEVKAR